MRLIDADALMNRSWGDKSFDETGVETWYEYEITKAPTVTIKDMIAGLPEHILQAQAEALRKNLRASSHWAESHSGDIVCYRCGQKALFTENGFTATSNFCPNCGQKMFDNTER